MSNKFDFLLFKVAAQDEGAFNQLYAHSVSSLKSVARSLLRNEDSVNDVLQDAYLLLWNHAHTFDPSRGCAIGWMKAVVRYRALDYLSKQNKIRTHEQSTEYENDGVELASPEDKLGTYETFQSIDKALSHLDKSSKQAIVMAYYQGYKGEEIAEKLQLPLNTVKSKLRRGLLTARSHLHKDYIGHPFTF